MAASNDVPVDSDSDLSSSDYFEVFATRQWQLSMLEQQMRAKQIGISTVMAEMTAKRAAEGTDPLNANSCEPVRLGYWKFNTPDLKGEQGGSPPRLPSGVVYASSFDGYGVQINTNSAAVLRYRETEANGKVNIVCSNLSIRFFFITELFEPDERKF